MSTRPLRDWRDRSAYPSMKDWPRGRIRWEFLRRHPTYVRDWEQASEGARIVFAGMPGSVERYGLEALQNPSVDEPPGFVDRLAVMPAFGQEGDNQAKPSEDVIRFVQESVEFGLFLVRIDPLFPLGPQFKEARLAIGEFMREFGLRRPTDRLPIAALPRYLRLLDAKAADAKPREIADVLSAEHEALWVEGKKVRILTDENVRKSLQSARGEATRLTGVPWPEE